MSPRPRFWQAPTYKFNCVTTVSYERRRWRTSESGQAGLFKRTSRKHARVPRMPLTSRRGCRYRTRYFARPYGLSCTRHSRLFTSTQIYRRCRRSRTPRPKPIPLATHPPTHELMMLDRRHGMTYVTAETHRRDKKGESGAKAPSRNNGSGFQ